MGSTARQRAYKKVREAKRVLQTAAAAGHLHIDRSSGAAIATQATDILAGQYPCSVSVECDKFGRATIYLHGEFPADGSMRPFRALRALVLEGP
jgi:hypothetical protein